MDLEDLRAISTHSYAQLAGIMLLFYDHFLTFPAEVSYIWPQPISLNTFLFYSNRYIALIAKIVALIYIFANYVRSEESCLSFVRVHHALLFLNQAIVAGILTTRTIALYNKSRAVIFGILIFGVVMASVPSWSLASVHDTYISGWPGCQFWNSENTAHHFATAWETSALFDTMIFILTLARTLKLRKIHNMANSLAREGLLDILLRDGALYFAVMALANLANILTFYFARPAARGMFTIPASCIATALCSRLVLNLYEAATPSNHDDAGSCFSLEPMTTNFLTTRIELGTRIDDDHIDSRR